MSEAESLLNTLSNDDIELYTVTPETEEHIIIDDRRNIIIPEPLRRIAVQYDHNIETVTFDCPRYWDNNDLSKMYIYINYSRADNDKGRYLTKNVRIDETDSNIIHFDWTIGSEITAVNGQLTFLVCAVKTDSEGYEELHWNTELNTQMIISNGLECEDAVLEKYPDVINDIFTRLDTVISDNSEITANNATIIANNAKIASNAETLIARSTELTNAANAAVASHDELSAKLTYIENNMEEVVGEVAEEAFTRVTADLSNEFYRVKDEVLETGEASGSYIHLTDSAMAQMQELEVESREVQFTTTGKNLFDYEHATLTSYYDANGEKVNNGILGGWGMKLTLPTPIPSGTYTISLKVKDVDNGNDANIQALTENDTKLGGVNIHKSGSISFTLIADTPITKIKIDNAKKSTTTLIYDIQIEEGSTATEYEPYTGGMASPNPDYPQEISVLQGVNLFNGVTTNGLVADDGTITSNRDWSLSDYIEVKPNEEYTFYKEIETDQSFIISEYDKDKTFIKRNTQGPSTYNLPYTITTSTTTKYVRLNYNNTHGDNSYMFIRGKRTTSYVPYGYVRFKTTGKNLFKCTSKFKQVSNNAGVSIDIADDGLITLNGTAINNSWPDLLWNIGQNTSARPCSRYYFGWMVKNAIMSTTVVGGTASAAPLLTIVSNDDSTENKSSTVGSNNYSMFDKPLYGLNRAYLYIARDTVFNNYMFYVQLEEGTTVTEYEPYQESILNIPIPEGEFVGYINDIAKDEIRVAYNEEDGAYHLYLDKMLAKVVFNGSEYFSAIDDNKRFFTNSSRMPELSKVDTPKSNTSTNITPLLCTHYLGGSQDLAYFGSNYVGFSEWDNVKFIYFPANYSTTDDFKAFLQEQYTNGTPVEVVYPLETPYTLDLGMVDMPISYDGVTNIFLDTDFLVNINAAYYRNFTETIRNLQLNNDTLKNELASIESRLSALETAQAKESGVED